jgi:hypothetical protein
MGMFGQQIDNFALAFIAPLGTDNYDICHVSLLYTLFAFSSDNFG